MSNSFYDTTVGQYISKLTGGSAPKGGSSGGGGSRSSGGEKYKVKQVSFNNAPHEFTMYLDNGTQTLGLNPQAIVYMTIDDSLSKWYITGELVIEYSYEHVENGPLFAKDLDDYIFRNDGFDFLKVCILPTDAVKWNSSSTKHSEGTDNFHYADLPQHLLELNLWLSIYNVEDLETPVDGDMLKTIVRYKKFYFRDYRYQKMLTTIPEYSSALSPELASVPTTAPDEARSLLTGKILREIIKKLEVEDGLNRTALDIPSPKADQWDEGGTAIFVTTGATETMTELVDYVLERHVAKEGTTYQISGGNTQIINANGQALAASAGAGITGASNTVTPAPTGPQQLSTTPTTTGNPQPDTVGAAPPPGSAGSRNLLDLQSKDQGDVNMTRYLASLGYPETGFSAKEAYSNAYNGIDKNGNLLQPGTNGFNRVVYDKVTKEGKTVEQAHKEGADWGFYQINDGNENRQMRRAGYGDLNLQEGSAADQTQKMGFYVDNVLDKDPRYAGVSADIRSGNFAAADKKLNGKWGSLPGGNMDPARRAAGTGAKTYSTNLKPEVAADLRKTAQAVQDIRAGKRDDIVAKATGTQPVPMPNMAQTATPSANTDPRAPGSIGRNSSLYENIPTSTSIHDVCLLSMARGPEVGEYGYFTLQPLSKYFDGAGKSGNGPGPLQFEHFYLQTPTGPAGANASKAGYLAPIKEKTSVGSKATEIRDLSIGGRVTIKNYKFVDVAAEFNSQNFKTRAVCSFDFKSRNYSIDFESNTVELARKFMAEHYIDKVFTGQGEREEKFLININKDKKDKKNIEYVPSVYGGNQRQQLVDGIHHLLYNGVFQNACINFDILGQTWREPGTFIGIDRPSGGDLTSTFDTRFCGQWFVIKVVHRFTRAAYFNNITAVRIHRHTPLEFKFKDF